MFAFIGNVIKYSFLALVIIVLSHVIEIQGTTISQHVLNGMHLVSGYSPKNQMNKITSQYTETMQKRMKDLEKIDSDTISADQKALNKVIENSQQKK